MIPFSRSGILFALLLMLPAVFFSSRIESALNRLDGRTLSLSSFPRLLGEWQGEDTSELDNRSQDILQLDEYIRRIYRTKDGRAVFVYVGYWKRQSGEHQAAKHSPLLCFPANGMKISSVEARTLSGKSPFEVSRISAKDPQHTSVYYYWFFSGDETYREESTALLHIVRQSLLEGRSDGGIVEISAAVSEPADSPEKQALAEVVIKDFAKEFLPELERLIHRPPQQS